MLVNGITAWAMAAVLAVLRAGAVLIPNDAADPAALRAELIAAAEVAVVLCERPVEGLPAGVRALCMAKPDELPPAELPVPPPLPSFLPPPPPQKKK